MVAVAMAVAAVAAAVLYALVVKWRYTRSLDAARWMEALGAAERESGGGGGAAAAAGGGSGGEAADDDEFAHPCPICLDTEDYACVDGKACGMCFACGQGWCGGCNLKIGSTGKCPTCRAPFKVSDEEEFKRLWKLVHDRSPGRHTPLAQCNLGAMYGRGHGVKQDHKEAVEWYSEAATQELAQTQCNLGIAYVNGHGVDQDYKEAFKWFRKAAEQGRASAQYNLGNMYYNGDGVKQDRFEAVEWYRKAAVLGYADAQFNVGAMHAKGNILKQDFASALTWFQLAAEQGHENALRALNDMQQKCFIPTLPPGTVVTTVLLTSAAGSNHNNKPGVVVTPTEGTVVRPGQVAVLLEGAAAQISFKLMNLRV